MRITCPLVSPQLLTRSFVRENRPSVFNTRVLNDTFTPTPRFGASEAGQPSVEDRIDMYSSMALDGHTGDGLKWADMLNGLDETETFDGQHFYRPDGRYIAIGDLRTHTLLGALWQRAAIDKSDTLLETLQRMPMTPDHSKALGGVEFDEAEAPTPQAYIYTLQFAAMPPNPPVQAGLAIALASNPTLATAPDAVQSILLGLFHDLQLRPDLLRQGFTHQANSRPIEGLAANTNLSQLSPTWQDALYYYTEHTSDYTKVEPILRNLVTNPSFDALPEHIQSLVDPTLEHAFGTTYVAGHHPNALSLPKEWISAVAAASTSNDPKVRALVAAELGRNPNPDKMPPSWLTAVQTLTRDTDSRVQEALAAAMASNPTIHQFPLPWVEYLGHLSRSGLWVRVALAANLGSITSPERLPSGIIRVIEDLGSASQPTVVHQALSDSLGRNPKMGQLPTPLLEVIRGLSQSDNIITLNALAKSLGANSQIHRFPPELTAILNRLAHHPDHFVRVGVAESIGKNPRLYRMTPEQQAIIFALAEDDDRELTRPALARSLASNPRPLLMPPDILAMMQRFVDTVGNEASAFAVGLAQNPSLYYFPERYMLWMRQLAQRNDPPLRQEFLQALLNAQQSSGHANNRAVNDVIDLLANE